MRLLRATLFAAAFLLMSTAGAWADWEIKPFIGATFGGGTTFLIDLEHAVGKPNVVFGVNAELVGEIFGVEADVSHAPGFFQSGSEHLVSTSSVTTLTGNITINMPRHLSQYTLRPYFVGGGGMVHPSAQGFFSAFDVSKSMPAIDLGGGVTGFLTRRIGVNWDIRHFRTINGATDSPLSLGQEKLSFWRAQMALAFRY